MRKNITFIEVIIVLCVIVILVKGLNYKKPQKQTPTPVITPQCQTPVANNVPTVAIVKDLEFVEFTFLENKQGPATKKNSITKDETLYFKFTVKGYATDSQNRAWIAEDFSIEDTSGKEICGRYDILDYHEKAEYGVVITNNFTPSIINTPPGKYVAHVVVRDKNGTARGEERYNFEITE